MVNPGSDIEGMGRTLASHGYIADAATSTVAGLALALGRPLLADGPPGTGKTQLAVLLAAAPVAD